MKNKLIASALFLLFLLNLFLIYQLIDTKNKLQLEQTRNERIIKAHQEERELNSKYEQLVIEQRKKGINLPLGFTNSFKKRSLEIFNNSNNANSKN